MKQILSVRCIMQDLQICKHSVLFVKPIATKQIYFLRHYFDYMLRTYGIIQIHIL